MSKKDLIEGEDYYIEDGKWVFTEAYHKRKGKCCGNTCRYCPYGYENVPDYKKNLSRKK